MTIVLLFGGAEQVAVVTPDAYHLLFAHKRNFTVAATIRPLVLSAAKRNYVVPAELYPRYDTATLITNADDTRFARNGDTRIARNGDTRVAHNTTLAYLFVVHAKKKNFTVQGRVNHG